MNKQVNQIELIDVSIKLQDRVLIRNFNTHLKNNEVLSIMGKSGSGKSTLLNSIISKLNSNFKFSGDIKVNQQSILLEPTEKRGVGILYQDDLLFPHMSILQNLLFAYREEKNKKDKINNIKKWLIDMQLGDIDLNAKPIQFSGGQKLRLALFRTLLSSPKIILLDEPFSKLDVELRANIRSFVWQRLEELQIPCIMVTHDQQDVPSFSRLYKLS